MTKNNNNKCLQSFSNKTAYCSKKSLIKPLIKQAGQSSFLFLIIIVGLSYGAYVANEKGYLNSDKFSSISQRVGSTLSFNDDFKGYGIQLMATKQLEQAKGVMNDFARDGYSAFVVASQAKGRTLYKVRLGPYSHKPEALAIQDTVMRRYPQSPYVKSSLVIYKPN